MNVHDALEYYVHKSVKPAEVIRVLQPAVVFAVSGWPPLLAEWHCGERWGSVRELDVKLGPDGSVLSVRVKTGKQEEPEIELGEEDEEDVAPAPEGLRRLAAAVAGAVVPQAGGPGGEPDLAAGGVGVRAYDPVPVRDLVSADHLEPRTVVIAALRPFPKDLARQLVDLVSGRPGPNTVKLKLADGTVLEMAGTSGIGPQDEPEVSVLLGGAVVRYDESSVDLAALGEGVIALCSPTPLSTSRRCAVPPGTVNARNRQLRGNPMTDLPGCIGYTDRTFTVPCPRPVACELRVRWRGEWGPWKRMCAEHADLTASTLGQSDTFETERRDVCDARAGFIIGGMRDLDVEVTVSTNAPEVATPYTMAPFVCPHERLYWIEPTGDQIAKWEKEGVK
jgi:hypothetical protein